MKKIIGIISALLTFCLLGGVCVSATTVADLGSLEGKTLISWNDFYTYAKATTGTDKGVLTRVTGAEGDYSTYIQYEVQGITTASENSRIIEYKDNGGQGLSGHVAAGDNMLLRLVIRSVGTEGKTKATSLVSGNGTTSKPSGTITIPTQWTEVFVPMTAGGNANYFTLRFGYFNQTVQIADLSLVNYGSATVTGFTQTPQKGGTSVSTDMFANARQLVAGQTLFVEPVAADNGDMLLLTLPVRGLSKCVKVEIMADMAGKDLTMTYYAPVQWSNIYVPFKCDTALNGISICVEDGAVQFGPATLENKGSATFESLALQSGMWLLEDYEQIVLKESQGVKALNEDFYAQKGITSGRTADLVISSDGKYVYSIGDGMLTVTDITDTPRVVSKITGFGDVAGTSSLGDTRQICLLPGKGANGGDAVVFTARSYGAFIFDMADPAKPVELAHYDALEMATGLAVYGDYAFVCSRFYGVEVVDLSTPSQPKHLCTILNEGGEVQSCKVVDGILYAGEYNNNCVSIYDVTDPINYKKLGVCALNGRGDGMTVATVGGKTYLYAGTGHHSVSGLATSTPLSNLYYGQGNGLDIFDVTDPANPKWLSTSKIDGRFYNASCDFWGAEYSYDAATGKSYAYLVSTHNGLYVFDVTDPVAPVRVAHISLELLPDSPNYSSYGLTSSSRAYIYNFDTTGANPVKYGAVGAVGVADGMLCIAGVSSDLYVVDFAKAYATDTVSEDVDIALSGDYYSFDAFSSLEGYASATVEGGQTYAVDTLGDYVYVATGAKGIMIYDKDLVLKGSMQTDDICYDLYIQDGKMYTAQGRAGVVIYSVDGLTLTETWRHVSTVGQVTMVRPSATGKFVALHVGAISGQIVRVSDKETVVSARATSQMYHHNVTALVDGRYMGFWANSSSERWYDFGENDSLDTPVLVTDSSSGYTPRAAMTGGITAYGDKAMSTGGGGYYLYDPATVTAAELKALAAVRPVDGYGSTTKVSITGKPTVAGNMLISADRIYSKVYITDISNINAPVLLVSFTQGVGNPDIAKAEGDTVYIPLGYMGVVKFTLSQFEPDGAVHAGGSHCLCNGHTVPDHSCENLTWEAWGDSDDEVGKLPTAGNYYLVRSMSVSSTTTTGNLNLCLNGQTVTATGKGRLYTVASGHTLSVTDCRGSGEMVALEANGVGGIITLKAGATTIFNLFGGTLRGGKTIAQNGGLIYSEGGNVNIHGGAIRDGKIKAGVDSSGNAANKHGGNIRVDGGSTVTITGGEISGGLVEGGGSGGNIYIGNGHLVVKGGTITGGQTKGENGGNIYINSGCSLEISGGTISNGRCAKRGNNIYVAGKSSARTSVTMSGGTITNDYKYTSGTMMGDININNYVDWTMSGGTVSGGQASSGGNYHLNLNSTLTISGGKVTGGYASGTGGNIYVNASSKLIVTGGTIENGVSATQGGNIGISYNASYADSGYKTYAEVEITGGTVSGGVVTGGNKCGGNICIARKGIFDFSGGTIQGGTVSGSSSYGGNVYLDTEAVMTMTGGIIKKGQAGTRGGNVSMNATSSTSFASFDMTGGQLLEGNCNSNGGNLYVLKYSKATISGDAVITGGTAVTHGGNICGNGGCYLTVYGGNIVSGGAAGQNGDNIYCGGYLTLDLMGHDLSGVFATVSQLVCYDSATDTYDGSKAGKLTFCQNQTDTPYTHWQDPVSKKRYMTIEDGDSYEFHRFYLGITKMTLRPAFTGVGYKAVFAGSDAVKAQLSSYGYKLWLSQDNVATVSKEASSFVSLKELTLRLQNFDVANYGDTPIYGSVFMELKDGTVIESATCEYTLKNMVEAIAANTDSYSQIQMSALKTMCEKYADAMADWAIDNILNYAA